MFRRLTTLLLATSLAALPIRVDADAGSPRLAVAVAQAGFFEDLSRSINRSLGYERSRKSKPRRAVKPVAVKVPLPAAKPAVRAADVRASPAGTPADAPQVARPVEFVVSGIDDAALVRLASEGFRILQRRESGLLGGAVLRLAAPEAVSFEAGLARIRSEAPLAHADANPRYDLEADGRCSDRPCRPGGPGGTAPSDTARGGACAAPIRLGLVAGRPDFNRPGLSIDRVDLVGDLTDSWPTDASLVERWTLPLPAATLAVRPVAPQTDAYALAEAFDDLHAAGAEVIIADVGGPANGLLATLVSALAEDDVPTVSPAGFARGRFRVEPDRLTDVGARVGALRSTRPYLNADGIADALAGTGRLDDACGAAVALTARR